MLQHRKIPLKFLFFGLCVGVFFSLGLYLVFRPRPLLSPITSTTTFSFLAQPTQSTSENKVVYGFLPYWNINKAKLHPELTHLAYFSLTIQRDGSIATKADGSVDMGYSRWSSEPVVSVLSTHQEKGGRVEIVLTQFNNDDIASFLSNKKAQENLFRSLDAIILASPVDGVNVDIEYSGEITVNLRKNFVEFMQNLDQHLARKYPKVSLSIDMYSSASENKSIWDVPEIAKTVDYIVVMAYDFHRRSSPVAGPVAPLFGGDEVWNKDITQHIRLFLQSVPKEKILLGVPFYGYEWQTTSRASQAHTYPDTGSTASIDRVSQLLTQKDNLKVEEHWNESALSPYLSYQKNNSTYIVYYENSRSLSYKIDLVNQLDLGGIAIWALGYEGDARELWDVIQKKL